MSLRVLRPQLHLAFHLTSHDQNVTPKRSANAANLLCEPEERKLRLSPVSRPSTYAADPTPNQQSLRPRQK